jgi:hypothetical protein
MLIAVLPFGATGMPWFSQMLRSEGAVTGGGDCLVGESGSEMREGFSCAHTHQDRQASLACPSAGWLGGPHSSLRPSSVFLSNQVRSAQAKPYPNPHAPRRLLSAPRAFLCSRRLPSTKIGQRLNGLHLALRGQGCHAGSGNQLQAILPAPAQTFVPRSRSWCSDSSRESTVRRSLQS